LDWHRSLHILKIRTGNIQKTNFLEKGLSTIFLENQLKNGIKKYYQTVEFDLVLYTTPPITLVKPVSFVKKRDNALCYLLLKDIFPQNAVDLGVLSKTGVKGLFHKAFRKKEKRLYSISDRIGCMSQANVDYVLKHNQEISPDKVEVCPNCVEVINRLVTQEEKIVLRQKYGIPTDKMVFIYGGNLGRPQGIPFLIDCLKAVKNSTSAFFVIIGDGTEYGRIETFINEEKPGNILLMKRMAQEDFDRFVVACDIGMIFLDHRFTIPNFPSRLLGYLQAGLPVLACTDSTSDVGSIIQDGGFGWWCESNSVVGFQEKVNEILGTDVNPMRSRAKQYLKDNYSIDNAYNIITNRKR
jgi:glycosyltransferase involved in cell wall biosynthesis